MAGSFLCRLLLVRRLDGMVTFFRSDHGPDCLLANPLGGAGAVFGIGINQFQKRKASLCPAIHARSATPNRRELDRFRRRPP